VHNTRVDNLRFKITFSETNLRYLLGADVINQELVDFHRDAIAKARAELDAMEESEDDNPRSMGWVDTFGRP
jgi:hypothetical protein